MQMSKENINTYFNEDNRSIFKWNIFEKFHLSNQ